MFDNQELGYCFQPKNREDAPGHPRLDIILHSRPTGKHFDPERVLVIVAEATIPESGIEHLSIRRNWHGKKSYRVCAGCIRLTDRRGKSVDAYSFGGNLQIDVGDDKTTVVISSPAPILELSQGHTSTLADLLAAEAEVLLARRRAFWTRQNPVEYERRLAAVEPLALYHTCIEALSERFREFPRAGEEDTGTIKAFKRFLRTESGCLTKHRGGSARVLADIL